MNPALMNYLQSQQPNQMDQNQQQVNNPFDAGINRAIAAARESLGMTEKQQDKALRRSMLTFADNIAQQPKQKGFFNNFGSAARAMNPAIMQYDEMEDQAEQQNQGLANQLLAYQAADETRRNAMEHQSWARGHAENQLAEQRRYHDMMNNYQQQKLNQQMNPSAQNSGSDFLLNNGTKTFIPFRSQKDSDKYIKAQDALGGALHEVDAIDKYYNKFKKKYENNVFHPMSAFGKLSNPAKDFFGKFTNNKDYRDETADRLALQSQLNMFVTNSERALSGGGKIGVGLIRQFKEQGIYPDINTDTPEVLEAKFKGIKHLLENSYKAANLSLQHKVHVNPYEIEEFEKLTNPQAQTEAPVQENNSGPFDPNKGSSPMGATISSGNSLNNQTSDMQNDIVILRNKHGIEAKIPANDAKAIQDAIKDGFEKI